jgi:ribosome-binding protein aMBF1 (putative translation factor)
VVVDVFEKKTGKTPKSIVDVCKTRLRNYDNEANQAKKAPSQRLENRNSRRASEFSPEEVAYIELKHALSNSLRERRSKEKLSQVEVAKLFKTSQSRVAKMEAGNPSVSIDLLAKSLLALGVSSKDLAKAIS